MNWKKIIKYALTIWLILTIAFIFLAQRDITEMYGGLTERVDPAQFEVTSEPVRINNVSVLSSDGKRFYSGKTVIIENGIISTIDTLVEGSSSTKTINGSGKYLIPGLVDSHAHLFKSSNDLLLYVANGITHIREMIGSEDILAWREEIENGRLGPDMYVASPRLGSFEMIEGWFMSWSQGFMNISTAEEAEEKVRKLHAKGYDAVKIYSHLNKESYDAINKHAASLGMDVVGHVPFSLKLSEIWKSNQIEIAHLEEVMNALNREFQVENDLRREFHSFNSESPNDFLDFAMKRSKEIAPHLIENGVSITTTLWLTESFVKQKFELENLLRNVEIEYENPGISEWKDYIPQGLAWLPENNRYKMPDNMSPKDLAYEKAKWERYGKACGIILKVFSENGVNILAGTDCNLPPTVPGFSLHDELISMNRAGLTTAQVLNSATAAPGQWLDNNAGIIATGRKANLVLLDKNPLEDISHTKSINTVILNGKILDRTTLDAMLDAVKNANNASRKKDISLFLDDDQLVEK